MINTKNMRVMVDDVMSNEYLTDEWIERTKLIDAAALPLTPYAEANLIMSASEFADLWLGELLARALEGDVCSIWALQTIVVQNERICQYWDHLEEIRTVIDR